VTFSPEVEARFKRIEDANAATAELLRVGQERWERHEAELRRVEAEIQEERRRSEAAAVEMRLALGQLVGRVRDTEDTLLVEEELRRRAEQRTRGDIERLAAIQNAMAKWQGEMADALAELSRTVDRFLKARTNGGSG